MGGAMLAAWSEHALAESIVVVEPSKRTAPRFPAATFVTSADELPADFSPDIVVVAIKPQLFDDVLPGFRARIGDAAVLSVAAGKRIADHQRLLGDRPIIRVLPNTPVAIGQGAIGCFADSRADESLRARVASLLAPLGLVEWLPDEALADAVTALSGSGPAYVFLLIEALAQAGVAQGLPDELAMRLARQTIIGSAALAADNPDTPASQLRANVTSKGGVTAAALGVLMADGGIFDLYRDAFAANVARAKQLSG
ncbi:pyrroline-5-carboxylate reductase [Rhodospirillales bacterium TMPK1]|uniref:Pyrroline-5-carboxylate reductase n=2 Tax=Roseiterribacter gracilis TaxID=2812848 RepID=A0A8S8XEL4_9PROT|nr:pyrroline-5-carboxylate reductase [Rhodospirillales bacterium TMPK1]